MKKIGTCETCVHWHRYKAVVYRPGGIRPGYDYLLWSDVDSRSLDHYLKNDKGLKAEDTNFGLCTHPKLYGVAMIKVNSRTGELSPLGDSDEVNFEYSEDGYDPPVFRTGKDFGCIHWEERAEG